MYIRLGKYTSEKIGIFKMKLRLNKSSRLLQRIAFIVLAFVPYSRNKLIKFDTPSITCNVCHSTVPHESTKYSIYVHHNRKCTSKIWQLFIKRIITFSLQQFFLFPILFSIIFSKSFAFESSNVRLKFNVKKFVL